MLKVEQLNFTYRNQKVLHNISFELPPGEVVALTGDNGAGKTTLLRLLATVLIPDSGTIELQGVNPLLHPLKYRRTLGYLPETFPLYDEMKIEEYLVLRLRLKGERPMRIRRRVRETLELCGLTAVRHNSIHTLSQGYRKRVGLADALLTRPRLILLDNLWAALDQSQRQASHAALGDLGNRSVALIAGHELTEMLAICTRVLVLYQGQLCADFQVAAHPRADLLNLIADAARGTPPTHTTHKEPA